MIDGSVERWMWGGIGKSDLSDRAAGDDDRKLNQAKLSSVSQICYLCDQGYDDRDGRFKSSNLTHGDGGGDGDSQSC